MHTDRQEDICIAPNFSRWTDVTFNRRVASNLAKQLEGSP